MSAPQRSLLRTAGSISLATMISRVLGLVRDQVQSYYFGAGLVTDAYYAAFRIPNLLRDLFAEGALSSAFVPTFTARRELEGPAAAFRLARRLITVLALLLASLAALIALAAPWIVRLYAPGFAADPEKLALTVTMTRILAPFLLFVALAAVAMGLLNACGRFFVPAMAPVFFNLCSIAAVVGLYGALGALGLHPGLSLAIGALAGGVMQFVVQWPAMRGQGFRFRPELAPRDPGLRRIARLMLPATFGLAATQINILVDTVLASSYDGAITWLSLAFRLMMLPIGVFGVALATANLARVSRDAALGDREALRGNLAASLRAAALLTLPSAAGLIALREPIVRVLFEHGEFDSGDTARTAAAALCYAAGLYAFAVTKIQVPTFYALGDTRRPVAASAGAVALKIAASLLLIRLLPRFGVEPFLGLAIATALAAWTNFIVLGRGLLGRLGSLRAHRVVSTTLMLAALSAAMGWVCAAFHAAVLRAWPGGGLAGELSRLGSAVALGIALFGAGAYALRVPEVVALRSRFRDRRS